MSMAAQSGAEFGRRLAEPHAKKPVFVLAVALITIGLGSWLAWSFRPAHLEEAEPAPPAAVATDDATIPLTEEDSTSGLFWLGIIVAGFGGIGLIRSILLFQGKDFETQS